MIGLGYLVHVIDFVQDRVADCLEILRDLVHILMHQRCRLLESLMHELNFSFEFSFEAW